MKLKLVCKIATDPVKTDELVCRPNCVNVCTTVFGHTVEQKIFDIGKFLPDFQVNFIFSLKFGYLLYWMF